MLISHTRKHVSHKFFSNLIQNRIKFDAKKITLNDLGALYRVLGINTRIYDDAMCTFTTKIAEDMNFTLTKHKDCLGSNSKILVVKVT